VVKEKFMRHIKLHTLAIAAITAGSLALPLSSIAQAADTNAKDTSATQAQSGAQTGTKAASTKHMNKTASAKHMKKHMRMSRSMIHKRKLYGSTRTPTGSQNQDLGAGTSAPTGNGPSTKNPSGVK
jgi:hypothetical protein